MRAIARPDGLAYLDMAHRVSDGDRLRAALDATLESALAKGDKPIRWRMGRGPAVVLSRPDSYAGLPITYEGHGWQCGLEVADA